MSILIWGRYKGTKPENIDIADWEKSATYLVREYQLAYGKDWIIWAGRMQDEPTKEER